MKRYSSREEFAAIVFLLLLAAFYFLPVLTKGNTQVLSRVGTDTWGQFFYWRHFGYSAIARGEIPLWNPYIFSGTPYIAGIQSAIFYPLNILYLLFDTSLAINLSIVIHCFLASLFTYLFARYIDISRAGAVLAGVTFAYGAPYFFHIYPGHLSNLSTMVWLPLLFLGVEAFLREEKMAYAVLSGIVLAMQLLAGHAQYLFYSAIAVSLYFSICLAFRKEWTSVPYFLTGFCIFVITGISLSAVQLLPTLELTQYSVREALSYEWVSEFSFPPESLLTLLFPDFFGDMLDVPYWGKNYLWEMSIYLGVVPLTMAAAGIVLERRREVLVFTLIAAVALLLALGKHTPLLMVLYSYVPGFNLFRGLSKFIFVFAFATSLVAGYGLQKVIVLVEERSARVQVLSYTLITASLFSLSLGIAAWLSREGLWRSLIESFSAVAERYDPLPPLTDLFFETSLRVALHGVFKTSILLMLLGVMLLVFTKVKRVPLKLFGLSLLVLAGVDLWHFGSRYLVTFDARDSYMDKELRAFLKSDKESFRVVTPFFHLLNVGMSEQVENVGGYDAFVLKNYSEFMNFAQGLRIDEPNIVMELRGLSPALNLLNVKYYIIAPARSIELAGFGLVFQNNHYRVYRNDGFFPRAYVVHEARIIKGRDAIFRHIASGGFNPVSSVVIEESVDKSLYAPGTQSPVPRIIHYSLNRVSVEADLREPGFLVLADAYYPGWKAFVDGRETKIYRANYVARAVPVPKGNHIVEFRYRPLSFTLGTFISLTALILVFGFLIFKRFPSRNPVYQEGWHGFEPKMDRSRSLFFGLILVALTVAVFWQVQNHTFVGDWDDKVNVKENPYLNPVTLPNVLHFWQHEYEGLYIPFTYTVWAGVAKLSQTAQKEGAGELNPRPFHIANFLLHILSVLVVFAILKMLVQRDWAAGVGALLFALHPVQVEPVAWITGMKDLLSGFLSLVAVWQYLCYATSPQDKGWTSTRKGHYAAASVAFVLALLSKPGAIIVPLVNWVIDYWIVRRPFRQSALALVPWLLVAVPFVIIAKLMQSDADIGFIPSLWARPLIAADALAFYLYKLVVPVWLSPDYGRFPERVLREGWIYFTWTVPALLAFSLWVWRKQIPWLVPPVALFIVGILPVSGLIPFGFQAISTVADRYLYLSMLGPALALAWFLSQQRGKVVAAACVAILGFLGVKSALQTQIWHDSETLWRHAIAVSHEASVAHYNLGVLLAGRGEVEEAMEHYRHTLRIKPRYADAHNNLGIALVQRGEFQEAIEHYRQALEIDPKNPQTYNNLGIALANQGKFEEAANQLREALRIDPSYAKAHNNLGDALSRRGNLEEAIEHYRRAVDLNPDYPDAHNNLGVALGSLGKLEEAANHFREAVRIDPTHARAHFNLASALSSLGRLDEAAAQFREVIRIEPAYARAHYSLGVILASQGNFDAAVGEFREALRRQPEFAEAHEGLGRALALQGKRDEAVKHYEEALWILKSRREVGASK